VISQHETYPASFNCPFLISTLGSRSLGVPNRVKAGLLESLNTSLVVLSNIWIIWLMSSSLPYLEPESFSKNQLVWAKSVTQSTRTLTFQVGSSPTADIYGTLKETCTKISLISTENRQEISTSCSRNLLK
jgi:hypothetical protein